MAISLVVRLLAAMDIYKPQTQAQGCGAKNYRKEEARILGAIPTKRYSPGYKDFPLKAQNIFISLVGANIPGLRLSPAGFIQPEKTVTALKGISAAP